MEDRVEQVDDPQADGPSTQLVDDEDEDEPTAPGDQLAKRPKVEANNELQWGQDPLFWSYLCLLNVHVTKGLLPTGTTWEEVNRNRQAMGFNHALPKAKRVVSQCHVMGVLVRFHRTGLFTTFTIDDGTALLDCIEWRNNESFDYYLSMESKEREFPLGCVIRCFGKLDWPAPKFQSPFRLPVRRVLLSRPPARVFSCEEELFHWDQAMRLWETVYSAPFAPPVPGGNSKLAKETAQTSLASKGLSFEEELDKAIMSNVNNATKMPLISPGLESTCQEKYRVFFRILFEPKSLFREEPVMSLLAIKSNGNSAQQTKLGMEALRRLCFKGYVLVIDPSLDLYGVLTHEDFLAPAILRILAMSREEFLHTKLVFDRLRDDPRLCKISKDRFTHSLKRLLNDSIIYEGEPGMIAIVKSDSRSSTSSSNPNL